MMYSYVHLCCFVSITCVFIGNATAFYFLDIERIQFPDCPLLPYYLYPVSAPVMMEASRWEP
jgi:hypothetical protein